MRFPARESCIRRLRDRRTRTRQSRAQRTRAGWVAGLLTPPCGQCPAGTGDWCDPMHPPAAEMVLIDHDPPRLLHSTRIAAAVAAGHASRSVTIAQFAGGPVAAGLT